MPFRELLSVVGNAVKSVKSEAIKKSFKHTLFSLPQYGPRDKQEGSKRFSPKWIKTTRDGMRTSDTDLKS